MLHGSCHEAQPIPPAGAGQSGGTGLSGATGLTGESESAWLSLSVFTRYRLPAGPVSHRSRLCLLCDGTPVCLSGRHSTANSLAWIQVCKGPQAILEPLASQVCHHHAACHFTWHIADRLVGSPHAMLCHMACVMPQVKHVCHHP